jgi:hypothetical protein
METPSVRLAAPVCAVILTAIPSPVRAQGARGRAGEDADREAGSPERPAPRPAPRVARSTSDRS